LISGGGAKEGETDGNEVGNFDGIIVGLYDIKFGAFVIGAIVGENVEGFMEGLVDGNKIGVFDIFELGDRVDEVVVEVNEVGVLLFDIDGRV